MRKTLNQSKMKIISMFSLQIVTNQSRNNKNAILLFMIF